jgi:hypothetical protein
MLCHLQIVLTRQCQAGKPITYIMNGQPNTKHWGTVRLMLRLFARLTDIILCSAPFQSNSKYTVIFKFR